MTSSVSIIMYHYVRPLERSRYPEIKGLAIEAFESQITYIKRNYEVISVFDLMDAVQYRTELPPRALLLTFDDGYRDHFDYVFPVLDREKLPGCFFPAARCILEGVVLDVNKIHYILASCEDKSRIIDVIKTFVHENRHEYRLESVDAYWRRVAKPSRWDSPEVMFIKRMLQRELPEELRTSLTDKLFREYVSQDEAAFAEELYMSIDQLACLRRNGMYVGSHGFDHYWLDTLSSEEQEVEVDLAVNFLVRVGSNSARWVMCYPNGSYNDPLLDILRERGCLLGLTTETGIADINLHNPLTLPRLNTNDLPIKEDAAPNAWTLRATHQ